MVSLANSREGGSQRFTSRNEKLITCRLIADYGTPLGCCSRNQTLLSAYQTFPAVSTLPPAGGRKKRRQGASLELRSALPAPAGIDVRAKVPAAGGAPPVYRRKQEETGDYDDFQESNEARGARGDAHDGDGWVHARCCGEDAPVPDPQVGNLVALPRR